jgi:hypothetical protein
MIIYVYNCYVYSGVHGNERDDMRGDIKKFDMNITKGFCAREGISLIIRGHQYVPEGYRIMHSGHLITVFSARNYFRNNTNHGALLLIAMDTEGNLRVRPKTFKARNEYETISNNNSEILYIG